MLMPLALVALVGLAALASSARAAAQNGPAGARPAAPPHTITGGVGAAGFLLGRSTRSDVLSRLGAPTEVVEHETLEAEPYSVEMRYPELGMHFYYCARDPSQRIFHIVLFAPFRGVTETGVVMGSTTAAEVVRRYGTSKWVTSKGNPTWWLQYDGVWIHVEKDTSVKEFPLDEPWALKQVVSRISVVENPYTMCPTDGR